MNYLITFIISMVPLIELRGAVPYAITTGIPMQQAISIGVIGNMLPVPIIFSLPVVSQSGEPTSQLLASFFTWCLKKGHSGGAKLEKVAGERGVFLALMLFVGIPIPGTGAWTGTLAASVLDWKFKTSVLAVVLGVILAGIIMAVLTTIGLKAFI